MFGVKLSTLKDLQIIELLEQRKGEDLQFFRNESRQRLTEAIDKVQKTMFNKRAKGIS